MLRECLYALQGMNGDQVRFGIQDEFICELPTMSCQDPTLVASSKLGNGAQDAMQLCGQAAWYYRRIQNFIDSSQNSTARAWAEAMSVYLNQIHHSLLADLEAQLQLESSKVCQRAPNNQRGPQQDTRLRRYSRKHLVFVQKCLSK